MEKNDCQIWFDNSKGTGRSDRRERKKIEISVGDEVPDQEDPSRYIHLDGSGMDGQKQQGRRITSGKTV